MPRGIHNWVFTDVIRFLKDHGFRHNYTNGSHYFYVGKQEKKLRQVCVPFHGKRAIHPKTMESIIEQSGIPRKEWTNRI